MSRIRPLSAALFLLLVLLVSSTSSTLFAQTFRGGLNGTVTDPSGAVVPTADVLVVNTASGFRIRA